MKRSRGRPPKDPAETLSERIDIRITSAEKTDFEEAAETAEQSLSVWMRKRLRSAARRELRKAGKR